LGFAEKEHLTVRKLACILIFAAACSKSERDPGTNPNPAPQNPPANPPPPVNPPPPPVNPPPPPPVCDPGTHWIEGTQIFREATAEWGLEGVEGVRLSAGDVDGDGWIDLFVRRGTNTGDDFVAGTRQTWLLKNARGERFEDVTESSGIWQTRDPRTGPMRTGQVVAFADVDNDGDLDAYTGMSTGVDSANPADTSELMLNDGTGRFVLGPEVSDLRRAQSVDAVAGASFVDFDRDGAIDLWIGEHNYTPRGTQSVVFLPDHLYRGDGRGGFIEVSSEVGIETADWTNISAINQGLAHSRAWSTAACDLNGDGTTELLVASYGRAPNLLWQGVAGSDGVHFENRAVASGYAFDGDQDWTDNEFAKCYCQANRSAEGCANVAPPRISCASNWNHSTDRQPFRLGGNSGTTVCADLDQDGDLDLLTTEITHWWAGRSADRSELLVNTGESELRFERPGAAQTGITRDRPATNWDDGHMTAAALDFDNDGATDIYIGGSDYAGNRGLLYQQVSPGKFALVPITEGIDHRRSHGVVAADFDRDGDLDLMVGHSLARCGGETDCYPTANVRFFENVLGDRGHWIQLSLVGGERTNKSAIGARVTVRTGDHVQVQEVGGGYGHYGAQQDMTLHFGLGDACEAEVTIRWPDGELTTQTMQLASGMRYRIEQGSSATPMTP
jgi:enediyne biosynthesis protein E4